MKTKKNAKKKGLNNKIKVVLVIAVILFATSVLVVAEQTQIFAKDEHLASLGDGPPNSSIHIGGGNVDVAIVKTVEISGDTEDTDLAGEDSVYVVAHDAEVASSMNPNLLYLYIQQRYDIDENIYSIERTVVYFNTSIIPDGAIIKLAKITFNCYYGPVDGNDFSLVIQRGISSTHPHYPPITSDYNYLLYTGNGGSIYCGSIFSGTPFDINLNETGMSWINKSGMSKFMIRSSNDIDDVFVNTERCVLYSANADEHLIPKLTIEYYASPSICILGGHFGGG